MVVKIQQCKCMTVLTTGRLIEVRDSILELAENYELNRKTNLQNIATSAEQGFGFRTKRLPLRFQDGEAGETLKN